MPEFNPEKHYYGKPCKNGHTSGMRYIRSYACVECQIEASLRQDEKYPDKVREWKRNWSRDNARHLYETKRQWRIRNPESVRQYSRKWRTNNPQLAKEYIQSWAKSNPGKVREQANRRRVKMLNATPAWIDHEEVKHIYNLATEKGLVVDHIVPLKSDSVCGLHCADNLRCIPEQLNSHKGNRYWPNMPPKEP